MAYLQPFGHLRRAVPICAAGHRHCGKSGYHLRPRRHRTLAKGFMGTVHADPATADSPAAAAAADAASTSTPAPVPAVRVRQAGGHCGNCGFEDTGHYCSRCGEPLHGTKDTVLQIVWSDLVEGPVHNGFALLKTTWLILTRPRRFFDGVLRRQHGMTHVPFFMAPVWRRVSHKPHGVPNAVKYLIAIPFVDIRSEAPFQRRVSG
jgi:hypothetical protein